MHSLAGSQLSFNSSSSRGSSSDMIFTGNHRREEEKRGREERFSLCHLIRIYSTGVVVLGAATMLMPLANLVYWISGILLSLSPFLPRSLVSHSPLFYI